MAMGVGMRMGWRMKMSTKQSKLFRRRFIVAMHYIWFVGRAIVKTMILGSPLNT